MKRLTRYFLEGLLFLAPVMATIYVVYTVFIKVDGLFKFNVPGFGFLVTLLIITLIGFVASNLLTRKLLGLVDRLFRHLPLVKMIYTSVKDLIGAFVGDKKGFNKPVKLRLSPGGNLYALGFVTSENLDAMGIEGTVAVYLPQSYNFAGNLVLAPREHVTPVDAESGDVMAFIVSGGISVKHS
jgi:uncharacterized membrane protein